MSSSDVSKLVPAMPTIFSRHERREQLVQQGRRTSRVNATDEEVR